MPRKNPPRAGRRDDPHEKPYPGYAREMAAREERAAIADRARSNPFPGPLAEAFAADAQKLHGFKLQPVCGLTDICLERIKSPMLQVNSILLQELWKVGDNPSATKLAKAFARGSARAQKEVKCSLEEQIETIFCFIQPVDTVYALIEQGREIFRRHAVAAIAGKLNRFQITELTGAVSEWYSRSNVTAIKYVAPKGKDDGTFFTPPPPMTMASDGGQASSAH